MSTLNDLTLAQLTTAYGAIAGIAMKSKSFNSRAKAVSRLEALLAEKGLTATDAWAALGLRIDEAPATEPAADTDEADAAAEPAPEPISEPTWEDDEDDIEPEQTGPYGDDDIPGSEFEPGDVIPDDIREWMLANGHPLPETDEHGRVIDVCSHRDALPAMATDPEPAAAPPATADTTPSAARTGIAGMPAFLAEPVARAAAAKGFGETLIYLGHTPDEAEAAANWLERTLAHGLDTARPAREGARKRTEREDGTPKAPRDGSKQQAVIALLRRPEGATIAQIMAETDWQPHTIRGMISGALKKKLGLTITSSKSDDGERAYRIVD
jgi:hypothetical protein